MEAQWEKKYSGKTASNILKDEVGKDDIKKQASLYPSNSAEDLRSLDMEKGKQDATSPRGVLDACDSRTNKFFGENSKLKFSISRGVFYWNKLFKLWNRKSIKRLASFPPVNVPKTPKRKSRSARENPLFCTLYDFKTSLVNFTISELQAATNNFSAENMIGRGGYAEVYKGCLKNGQLIAVKRLTKGTADEKTSGFLSELGIIAHVNHPNTAKLVGSCVEEGMHLIFQLSPLGSLGSYLHGSNDNILGWKERYKIALGTADGLLYLHESCLKRIIHRDIKADNILLTEDFEPQICDFGLAKWLPKQCSHHSVSKFEGTFGYFAPEYFMHGIVDEKTDVYSFGVLLLELITGRPALDNLQKSLVIWAKKFLDDANTKELVDPSLGDNYVPEEMDRMILTASLCIEQSPILRPRMRQVIVLLRGDEYDSQSEKECKKGTLQRTYSEELLDAQEYNSTKYLSDMNKHQQVAFGS
ncbi:receptor-like cytosolic serine/threonine-protein kinase RBK2 isoform X2 [Humulus lupulus]|uniref:receptor-like cytosolic serine/threonine-protein kinase RBK2 isoform X2 n=1 Tax=Humulus lupulus TaxID=3486 RepID=UPI002B4078EC|nr:receptor-like cytosolic serine/threonine-protein kinase RBK2 isoform X2 [Humulus lupulus]